MSDPLPSGGVTERTAFDGYSLQVFPKHQYSLQQPSIYLSSNSDLFTCGSSIGDLISAQHLRCMLAKLQQEFAQDRRNNPQLSATDDPEGYVNYREEPFVAFEENNGIFMAIVGFASYSYEENFKGNPDCYWLDSELVVWAKSARYGGDFHAFCDAIEWCAIANEAGLPSRYRTSEGDIDLEGYSWAIQQTVYGGAQQYPPYYNPARHFENGQPRTPEFTMGPEGRQARLSFLKDCLNSQSQNGC
jgi:hypothetical protein